MARTAFRGTAEIRHADCLEAMAAMDEASVDAIVCDPPYGLEFMGKAWDKLGGDAGTSRPGIGARMIEWPSFGGSPFGGANPTCATCHGRARGQKLCTCQEPDWRVKGRPLTMASPIAKPGFADGTKPSFERVAKYLSEMQTWHTAWLTAALRVLKPGGHLVAFGGTRTFHRLWCAAEDAGFEIRDCLTWLYSQGFPKSHDIGKALDKAAGAERAKVRVPAAQVNNPKSIQGGHGIEGGDRPWMREALARGYHETDGNVPVTDAARQWAGWGTGLKPAWEPILLARKPISERNVAANVLRWGTGGINVDGCRVGTETMVRTESDGTIVSQNVAMAAPNTGRRRVGEVTGRWPANLTLDEAAAGMLDEQAGPARSSGIFSPHGTGEVRGGIATSFGGRDRPATMYGDSGGASCFFYTAKASPSDRGNVTKGELPLFGIPEETWRNLHPTVKPVALMKWLCTLVTPPGGLILDPFAGSGSTLIAAREAGFRAIGIEREAEYVAITQARLDGP